MAALSPDRNHTIGSSKGYYASGGKVMNGQPDIAPRGPWPPVEAFACSPSSVANKLSTAALSQQWPRWLMLQVMICCAKACW